MIPTAFSPSGPDVVKLRVRDGRGGEYESSVRYHELAEYAQYLTTIGHELIQQTPMDAKGLERAEAMQDLVKQRRKQHQETL